MVLNWLKPELSSPNQGPENRFSAPSAPAGERGPGGREAGRRNGSGVAGSGGTWSFAFRSGDQATAGMETRVLRSLTSREADTRLPLWPKAGPPGSLGSGASQPAARVHVRKPPPCRGGSVRSSPGAVAKRLGVTGIPRGCGQEVGVHRRWPGPPHVGLLEPVLRAASRAAHPRSGLASQCRDSRSGPCSPPSPSRSPLALRRPCAPLS